MQDDEGRGQPQEGSGGGDGNPQPVAPDHCHCVGHRLIVIIGNENDQSVSAALAWALRQTNVEHRVFYPATSSSNDPSYVARTDKNRQYPGPMEPNHDNTGWQHYFPEHPPAHPLATGVRCMVCCFYEEVIVIGHHHQQGLLTKLLGTKNAPGCLGFVMSGKPTKRFVLWICGTAADVYPLKHNQPGEFEWLAYFLAPPASCPCGCDPALCAICPHWPGCVTLLSAAWYDVGSQHWSARLGMSKTDPDDPFLSPDGRLLQTQICATGSGVMTTESNVTAAPGAGGAGVAVFNGKAVHADPNIATGGQQITPGVHTANSKPVQPPHWVSADYIGPHTCPNREGCHHDH